MPKAQGYSVPFRGLLIFCRSIKNARKIYKKLYKKEFNPNNKEKIEITEEGYLTSPNGFVSPKDIWDQIGYAPMFMNGIFHDIKIYRKETSNLLKFIRGD